MIPGGGERYMGTGVLGEEGTRRGRMDGRKGNGERKFRSRKDKTRTIGELIKGRKGKGRTKEGTEGEKGRSKRTRG